MFWLIAGMWELRRAIDLKLLIDTLIGMHNTALCRGYMRHSLEMPT